MEHRRGWQQTPSPASLLGVPWQSLPVQDTLEKVERAIREEVAAMIDEGVAARDLRRIRTQIESSFLFQDETVLDLAMKLARFEAGTPGGYRTLADVLPTYASIKKRELKEVAAKYFNFDRATVAWALPAAPPAQI